MDTTSTPSSATDGSGATAPEPAAPTVAPAPTHDAGRRAFFRSFGRQAFDTAAQVAGISGAVTKATTSAVANVAGILADPDAAAARIEAGGSAPASAGRPVQAAAAAQSAAHKSPYRLAGDLLILLDQRTLPGALDEQTCRRGSDVAFYARVHAVGGGALLGQLAAYGLALTAKEIAPRSPAARNAEWGRVRRALAAAGPTARMLHVAIERMDALRASFSPDHPGEEVAAKLRREADSLAMESQLDHAAIARALAARLPDPAERPVGILVHGAPGTSTAGMVGGALNALALAALAGRALRVWVTEGRPGLVGARLATWELAAHGIDPVVVPDGAVGYLLDTEPVDVVLMGAEWIAADGSVATPLGGRVVAEMAAAARPGPVPVWIAAPAETIDPATADGAAIPGELRPAREILAHVAGWKPEKPNALVPAVDVVPPGRVTRLFTEQGEIAPEPAALAAALAARRARRPVPPAPWADPADGPAEADADAAADAEGVAAALADAEGGGPDDPGAGVDTDVAARPAP
ncbi:MAG: hypothetical protein ACKOTZ_03280 [Chloroflexota bacterium]